VIEAPVPLNGRIDEIELFSRALAASEIQALCRGSSHPVSDDRPLRAPLPEHPYRHLANYLIIIQCMDIVARLEAARDRTLPYFEMTEEQLARRYGPGKWPIRFILHHLADAETVLFDRIRRVVSEPRQVLWAFDQDAWAKGLDYSRMPLGLSKQIYTSVRAGVIYQARLHYERSGRLEFVHSETGVRTLKDEFDKVAWHNEHHLEQIELALQESR